MPSTFGSRCDCVSPTPRLPRSTAGDDGRKPPAAAPRNREHKRHADITAHQAVPVTGPVNLSGPRLKEPRSTAQRLHALETKFLLFWVGQERDSVLSRSLAPRCDCSGLHERNLPVATLWLSPTSGRFGGRRFQAETGGGVQVGARHGPLNRWKVKPSWRRAWSVDADGKGRTARSLVLVGGRAH